MTTGPDRHNDQSEPQLTAIQQVALSRIAQTAAQIPAHRLDAFASMIEREAERERAAAVGDAVRDWPTSSDVVMRWRVPERTLRRHIAEGIVRPVRIGAASRFLRFDPVELLRVYGRPLSPEQEQRNGAPPIRRKQDGS